MSQLRFFEKTYRQGRRVLSAVLLLTLASGPAFGVSLDEGTAATCEMPLVAASDTSRGASLVTAGHIYTEKLERMAGAETATSAVVFIAGIYGVPQYFEAWTPALASPETVVLGWNHDHQAMSMGDASSMLAQELACLAARGVQRLTLIAHSMGGLVAKGAVDEMKRNGSATAFTHVALHAFGTPWGGFAWADLAALPPGSAFISRLIGYPMGPDIGPSSPYMANLAQPMPSNGSLHLYRGTQDDVAQPTAGTTRTRYASIALYATSTTDVGAVVHSGYNEVPVAVLDWAMPAVSVFSGTGTDARHLLAAATE